MKHFLTLVILFMTATCAFSDDTIPEPTQRTDVAYRLYRSQNVYMFLKLDTRTGLIWEVQWGEDADHRFVESLNDVPLADGKKVGRFTLYPSLNVFCFILLDQEDGRQWQVQWGKNKLIVPILAATANSQGH